jgi:hypothetical protein
MELITAVSRGSLGAFRDGKLRDRKPRGRKLKDGKLRHGEIFRIRTRQYFLY